MNITPALLTLLFLSTTISHSAAKKPPAYTECTKASYCLAIDDSASIEDVEHSDLLNGIVIFIQHLAIHAPGSRYAAFGFTDVASEIKHWTQDPAEMVKALLAYERDPSSIQISSGLEACGEALQGAPKPGVAILITNGGEYPPYSGKAAGDALRANGITVVSIGVRIEPDDSSVDKIADGKALEFYISKHAKLPELAAGIIHDICDELPDPLGLCPGDCPPAAVCFAVDESSSIKRKEFNRQAAVLAGLTSVFQTLAPASMYAGVGFSDLAHVFQPLTFDANQVMNAFLDNPQREGGSASGEGLLECKKLLHVMPGPKLIVLVADGQDNKHLAGTDVHLGIKEDGIQIVTAGIGKSAEGVLRTIASTVYGKVLFTPVSAFETFSQALGPIIKDMCAASAHWTPEPPASDCGTVTCAQCGMHLECYANTGSKKTDERACKAIENDSQLCVRKTRREIKTKCGQKCMRSGPRVSCYTGESFGLYEHNPSCKYEDGQQVFPSNFAQYRACKKATGVTRNKCIRKKCSSDRKDGACYPEHF